MKNKKDDVVIHDSIDGKDVTITFSVVNAKELIEMLSAYGEEE